MKIDKDIATRSSQYIGYLILKYFKKKKTEKLSIYQIYDLISKKEQIDFRQIKFGMIFLYSLGIIDFSEANIWLTK